jgi:hypothetical protein
MPSRSLRSISSPIFHFMSVTPGSSPTDGIVKLGFAGDHDFKQRVHCLSNRIVQPEMASRTTHVGRVCVSVYIHLLSL